MVNYAVRSLTVAALLVVVMGGTILPDTTAGNQESYPAGAYDSGVEKKSFLDYVDETGNLKSSCGGNCPSGGCPSCKCGSSRDSVSISEWCSKHSWSQRCCECVVSHESGGNAHAVNYNTNGSYDVGLWQINDVNWSVCSGGQPPCDPSDNLRCAIDVYNWGGHTFKLWSTGAGCGCA